MSEELVDPAAPQAPAATPQTQRVIVALDASRHSFTALKAAAELAALMEAELQALYVEDIDLIHLARLPFVHEIGLYSATRRPYDQRTAEREFQTLAHQMRHTVAQTAVAARVNWSFEVVRGNVTNELLLASNRAELLTLGRVGRTPGKRLGSTAQTIVAQATCPIFLLGNEGLTYPLTVISTGSPASARALKLASTLMRGREGTLLVMAMTDPQLCADAREQHAHRLQVDLGADDLTLRIHYVDGMAQMPRALQSVVHGTLILPAEEAALVEAISTSAILAP